METIIRKVKAGDVSDIFSHYKDWVMGLFPEYSETLRKNLVKKVFDEEYVNKKIKEKGIVLAAISEGQLVGVLIADKLFGGISYGAWLIVDSNFQRKGIGKNLLKHWEDEVRKQGGHGLRLDADKRNVEYYKKMGFRMIGLERKGYFGTDNYLFQKTIAEPKEENFFK